ncbi:MAG: GNAT family N-acetyltransferase [Bacteroidia bacterium]
MQKASSDELYDHVFLIRTEVFVDEVAVDQEDEYDGFDHLATHYLAWYGDIPAGTARWRTLSGSGAIRLERFAVRKPYRGLGIGSALVEAILADIPKSGQVFVHAQIHNLAFYQRFGFVEEGDEFEEAGLVHKKMVYRGAGA